MPNIWEGHVAGRQIINLKLVTLVDNPSHYKKMCCNADFCGTNLKTHLISLTMGSIRRAMPNPGSNSSNFNSPIILQIEKSNEL